MLNFLFSKKIVYFVGNYNFIAMVLVSSKEFVNNEEKYFNLAINEEIFIERGDMMFLVSRINDDKPKNRLKPDDDLRRAISMDEFKMRAREVVKAAYKRYINERSYIAESAGVS